MTLTPKAIHVRRSCRRNRRRRRPRCRATAPCRCGTFYSLDRRSDLCDLSTPTTYLGMRREFSQQRWQVCTLRGTYHHCASQVDSRRIEWNYCHASTSLGEASARIQATDLERRKTPRVRTAPPGLRVEPKWLPEISGYAVQCQSSDERGAVTGYIVGSASSRVHRVGTPACPGREEVRRSESQ
jgi:hypothetical protein